MRGWFKFGQSTTTVVNGELGEEKERVVEGVDGNVFLIAKGH